MTRLLHRIGFWLCMVLAAWVLAACSSQSLNRAPVEERQIQSVKPVPVKPAPVKPAPVSPAPVSAAPVDPLAVKLPPGYENAGKPGFYTVKPGDTLVRVALDNGQTMKDIARWSHVENPNHIVVGQVLRVVPPIEQEVVVNPVTKPTLASAQAASAAVAALPASSAASTPAATTATSTPLATSSKPAVVDGDINWLWPANGVVQANFDEVKNKGVDIGGKVGDPVLASADGRVVYVGSGLRGYGNLIILKHNNVFLSAYAHNQTLLVKEDQTVLRGQKIAEMGSSDTDSVKLHFEVRRQGKPVDPIKYLPAR